MLVSFSNVSELTYLEKSALAIHLRFIGVSRVMGRIDTTKESFGRPEFSDANDFVS
jgi:hypothetical protein